MKRHSNLITLSSLLMAVAVVSQAGVASAQDGVAGSDGQSWYDERDWAQRDDGNLESDDNPVAQRQQQIYGYDFGNDGDREESESIGENSVGVEGYTEQYYEGGVGSGGWLENDFRDDDGRNSYYDRLYTDRWYDDEDKFDREFRTARTRRSRGDSSLPRSEGSERDDQRNSGDRSDQDPRKSRTATGGSRTASAEGEIVGLATSKLSNLQQPYQFAKLQIDDDRTLITSLGPANRWDDDALSVGDTVQVRGIKVRVDDRAVLMASRVRHNDQTMEFELPTRVALKRVKAVVQNSRRVQFRGLADPYLVADVKTNRGTTETVNLGPLEDFKNVDLDEGKKVRLLVRPGRVNGTKAMIAQEVSVDGETIRVTRPKDRK